MNKQLRQAVTLIVRTLWDSEWVHPEDREAQKRAASIAQILDQVWELLWNDERYAYLHDVYVDNDQTIFLILSSAGLLYKVPVTMTNGAISLGEWQEVEIEFQDVNRTNTHIIRQADDTFRWVSVSCTAVLNRVGAIDSTDLFDSFVNYIEEGGEYPIRQFYHKGEAFRTGICDFVAREGFTLITSGIYDNTDLARMEVRARLADPGYWSDSIGFYPTETPELIPLSDGVEVPVYRTGRLSEISTLPEKDAAAWFTVGHVRQEVHREMNQREREAFIKLFDGDEAAADDWLEQNVEPTNRAVTDENLVARSVDSPDEPPVSTETETETTDPDPEGDPALEPEETIIDISPEMRQALAEDLMADMGIPEIAASLQAVAEALGNLTSSVDERLGAAEAHMTELTARMAQLEVSRQEEREIWRQDLPEQSRRPTLRYTRPRDPEKDAPPDPNTPATMEQKAEETLARLPSY